MCVNFVFSYCAQEQKNFLKMVERRVWAIPQPIPRAGEEAETLGPLPREGPAWLLTGLSSSSHLLLTAPFITKEFCKHWSAAPAIVWGFPAAHPKGHSQGSYNGRDAIKSILSLQDSKFPASGEGDHPVTDFRNLSCHFSHYWQK